jgi:hypothetical protein
MDVFATYLLVASLSVLALCASILILAWTTTGACLRRFARGLDTQAMELEQHARELERQALRLQVLEQAAYLRDRACHD